MNTNVGKYEPKVVKETIEGKQVKCNVISIDKHDISIGVGDNFVVRIVEASFDIDPEGYWWDLLISIDSDDTPVITLDTVRDCVITDLNVIDNFYEQLR
jgi:hypothetical protein